MLGALGWVIIDITLGMPKVIGSLLVGGIFIMTLTLDFDLAR